MNDLPQVGQKYQHKKWGEVEVLKLIKRGRGYAVEFWRDFGIDGDGPVQTAESERLKDFQKATA